MIVHLPGTCPLSSLFTFPSVTSLLHCCYNPPYSAYKWMYGKLRRNVPLQYSVWVAYPMALIMFASFFCNLVAPQAIGVYFLLFLEPLTLCMPSALLLICHSNCLCCSFKCNLKVYHITTCCMLPELRWVYCSDGWLIYYIERLKSNICQYLNDETLRDELCLTSLSDMNDIITILWVPHI